MNRTRSAIDGSRWSNAEATAGLRSLAPTELGYRGRYGGDYRERDSAYHQGTVWGWLPTRPITIRLPSL